jgi:putative membrane protein
VSLDPRLRIALQWLLNAVALMLLPELIDRLEVESYTAALVTALLLGLINALIRPLLILITLPITVLTLGLFTLVINALLFWGVANLVSGVHVPDFWTAFWSALLYSLLTWLVGLALGDPADRRIRVIVGRRRH